MEPSEGEQGAQCLLAPSALSWVRLPSWLFAPNLTWHAWGWGEHQPHECCIYNEGPAVHYRNIHITLGNKLLKKKKCDVLYIASRPRKISASPNTCSFFPHQSQVLIWQFLILQASINWVTNKVILVLIGWVSGVSIPVPLKVRRGSSQTPLHINCQLNKIVNHSMQWGCQMVERCLSPQNLRLRGPSLSTFSGIQGCTHDIPNIPL